MVSSPSLVSSHRIPSGESVLIFLPPLFYSSYSTTLASSPLPLLLRVLYPDLVFWYDGFDAMICSGCSISERYFFCNYLCSVCLGHEGYCCCQFEDVEDIQILRSGNDGDGDVGDENVGLGAETEGKGDREARANKFGSNWWVSLI